MDGDFTTLPPDQNSWGNWPRFHNYLAKYWRHCDRLECNLAKFQVASVACSLNEASLQFESELNPVQFQMILLQLRLSGALAMLGAFSTLSLAARVEQAVTDNTLVMGVGTAFLGTDRGCLLR